MKSCTRALAVRRRGLRRERAARSRRRSGSFQRPLLDRHWLATSAICVPSTQPATSTFRAATAAASAPSTGGAVSTGEQMRTRRRARAIACPIRWDRSSPWPGVNQTRTPSCHSGSTVPVPTADAAARRAARSPAGRPPRAAATRPPTITFSWRVHESSDQFVEPVQTASPSRTTYLWCIRSGTPAIGSASTGSASISAWSGDAGGGTGIGIAWSTL